MRIKIRFGEIQLILCLALSLILTACSDISPKNGNTVVSTKIPITTTNTPTQTYPPETSQPAVSPTVPAQPILATPTLPLPTATRIAETITPKVAPLPDGWERDWLLGKPCPLPCWEWLQPGATNVDEAVVMLKQNPLVEAGSIKFEAGSLDYNYVDWKWRGQNYGGSFSYAAKTASKLLKGIFIEVKGPFKLGDLIRAFGEPTHIYAGGTDSIDSPGYFYSLDLIWEKQGLMVPFFQGKLTPPAMTPELETFSYKGIAPINIVDPENFSNFEFSGYLGTIVPWQGFKPFSLYCYDIHTGKPCP